MEELREKIARDYLFVWDSDWFHDTCANWEKMPETVKFGYCKRADELLTLIEEAGYRKVRSEEPPVLSDVEIGHIKEALYNFYSEDNHEWCVCCESIAKKLGFPSPA